MKRDEPTAASSLTGRRHYWGPSIIPLSFFTSGNILLHCLLKNDSDNFAGHRNLNNRFNPMQALTPSTDTKCELQSGK